MESISEHSELSEEEKENELMVIVMNSKCNSMFSVVAH
jgi:hypothetical protein